MAGWTNSYKLLCEELIQRRDEGVVVPVELQARVDALHWATDAWNDQAVDPLYDALMALPGDAALAAQEPNDLPAIRALRPDGPRDLGWKPAESELLDRLHGAWTGRCVGCALGQPVEGLAMTAQGGRPVGRERIKEYLQARGDWPLRDYFSIREGGDALIGKGASVRENIACMGPDDDIHYSLVGLGVVEK